MRIAKLLGPHSTRNRPTGGSKADLRLGLGVYLYGVTSRDTARIDRRRHVTPHTTSPAGAGPLLAVNQLPLAARETETGKADAQKCERGGFRNGRRTQRGVSRELPVQDVLVLKA